MSRAHRLDFAGGGARIFLGTRPHAFTSGAIGRDLIVARSANGALSVLRQRGRQYELDRLARHHGITPTVMACRPHCHLVLQGGLVLAYHDRRRGLTQSCREADIIIMPFSEAHYPCEARLFDSRAFKIRQHRQFKMSEGRLQKQILNNNRLWQQNVSGD